MKKVNSNTKAKTMFIIIRPSANRSQGSRALTYSVRRFSNKYESIMPQEDDTTLNAKSVLRSELQTRGSAGGESLWEGRQRSAAPTSRGKCLRLRPR